MADDDLKFKLDLDADEFKKVLKEANQEIKTFGDPVNLSSLIVTLGMLPNAFNVLKGAIMALKEPLDLVFEGERIRAINQQFEILTANAGLSGSALKAGLEKAAGGLVDTTDLLNVANKSIIAMGGSASKLPEIMELARKASVVTGQSVAETFEQLSQAIATGQTRTLKQMGIVVDLDKAYQSYAESIGVATAALSEDEKRAALAAAALEKGNKALAGVDDSVTAATNAWTQLKVALQDLKETFILVFEKTIGPTVKKTIGYLSQFTSWVKTNTQSLLGMSEAGDRAAASIAGAANAGAGGGAAPGPEANLGKRKELEAKFQKELAQLQLQAISDRQRIAITEVEYDKNLNDQRVQLHIQYLAKLKEVDESKDLNDQQKRQVKLQLAQDEQTKLLAMSFEAIDKRAQYEKQDLDIRMQLAQTEQQASQLFFEQQFQLYAQFEEKIRLTRENQVLGDQEKTARILLLEQQLNANLITLQAQQEDNVLRSYENQVRAATTAYGKITAGAALASAKAKKEFLDFSSIGVAAVNRMASSSSQAFEQLGEGAIDLGTALKRAIIGAIADEAMARGALLIASSIFPPNPVGIAAGIGLSTLAGLLRGLAGGGASGAGSLPTGAGGGGGDVGQAGNAGLYGSQTPLASAPTPTEYQSPRKQVTVQIQGSYFDTDQTRTRLVEIIRDASDATDFKIFSVGSGG